MLGSAGRSFLLAGLTRKRKKKLPSPRVRSFLPTERSVEGVVTKDSLRLACYMASPSAALAGVCLGDTLTWFFSEAAARAALVCTLAGVFVGAGWPHTLLACVVFLGACVRTLSSPLAGVFVPVVMFTVAAAFTLGRGGSEREQRATTSGPSGSTWPRSLQLWLKVRNAVALSVLLVQNMCSDANLFCVGSILSVCSVSVVAGRAVMFLAMFASFITARSALSVSCCMKLFSFSVLVFSTSPEVAIAVNIFGNFILMSSLFGSCRVLLSSLLSGCFLFLFSGFVLFDRFLSVRLRVRRRIVFVVIFLFSSCSVSVCRIVGRIDHFVVPDTAGVVGVSPFLLNQKKICPLDSFANGEDSIQN